MLVTADVYGQSALLLNMLGQAMWDSASYGVRITKQEAQASPAQQLASQRIWMQALPKLDSNEESLKFIFANPSSACGKHLSIYNRSFFS